MEISPQDHDEGSTPSNGISQSNIGGIRNAKPRNSSESKKGISANHLLNFTLPPRQRPPIFQSNRKTKGISYQPYFKERFVNANYRFIVSSTESNPVQLMDPDALVSWSNIEQVIIPSSDFLSCPICLCEAVVPKVTRCGHVFCYSCALHYVSIEDSSKECPICHDIISIKDLRSVLRLETLQFTNNYKESNSDTHNPPGVKMDRIVMRLMQRSTGSTTILPRPSYSKWAMTAFPNLALADKSLLTYSKIMIANSEFILNHIISVEMAQLLEAIEEANSMRDPELMYLEMALEHLKNRESNLLTNSPPPKDMKISPLVRPSIFPVGLGNDETMLPEPALYHDFCDEGSLSVDESSSMDTDIVQKKESKSSDDSIRGNSIDSVHNDSQTFPTSTADSKCVKHNQTNSIKSPGSANDMFFFYQSVDGQTLYLHPLDIKILKAAFGSYESLPDEICVHISTLTETSITEEVRKRYRYLSHLPLSCDATFIEVDWKKTNFCRKSLMSNEFPKGVVSPWEFYRNYLQIIDDNSKLNRYNSIEELLSCEQVHTKWKNELSVRQKRHEEKAKKERKESRRRRLSSSENEETKTAAQVLASRSRDSGKSNDQVLNFDDNDSWSPLSPCVDSNTITSNTNIQSYADRARQPAYSEQFPPVSRSDVADDGTFSSTDKRLQSEPGNTGVQHAGTIAYSSQAGNNGRSFAAALSSSSPPIPGIGSCPELARQTSNSMETGSTSKKKKKKQVTVLFSSGARGPNLKH